MNTPMTDPGVYLAKLSAFSRLLRLKGLPIGPRETADAVEILISLGFEDREQVKTALRTVYAKSREEQLSFDRVFDGFFLSEEAIRAQAKEQAEQEMLQEAQRAAAREELETMENQVSLSEAQHERGSPAAAAELPGPVPGERRTESRPVQRIHPFRLCPDHYGAADAHGGRGPGL